MSKRHVVGHIQSCGYLFAVREDADCPSGLRILCASSNVEKAPWMKGVPDLIGNDIGRAFRQECVETIRALLGRHMRTLQSQSHHAAAEKETNTADILHNNTKMHAELQPTTHGETLTCTLAGSSPGVYILEIEQKHGAQSACASPMPGLLQVADVLGCVAEGHSPTLFAVALCEALMEMLSAYDRVVAYRFSADRSLEAIHETFRPGFVAKPSLPTRRSSAEDCLPEVRTLLELDGVHFVSDTSAPNVPIEAGYFGEDATQLDLSMSALSAPPQHHLCYLRNAGVRASLAVTIFVGGDLWGAFCFESFTRLVSPTCEERTMVGMAATIAAAVVSRYEREEVAKKARSLSRTLDRLMHYPGVDDFLSAEHPSLLKTLDIDAIVLCEHMHSVDVYGDQDLSITLEEAKDLLEEAETRQPLLLKSLGKRSLAFFSVRSFLVAFVRASAARGAENFPADPSEPLAHRQTASNLRASSPPLQETLPREGVPFSRLTKDLLEAAWYSIASHLFSEVLPADLQDTFAQISHELRTPFHGVVTSLQTLKAGEGNMGRAEREDIIDAALASGNSMMDTLNDILDIAKGTGDAEAVSRRFVAGAPILRTMVAMKPLAAAKSVTVVVDIESLAGEGEVLGGERRIRHILKNLIKNAIKYTQGERKVKVTLVAFDYPSSAIEWWERENTRFDANIWMGTPPAREDPEGAPHTRRWYVYCVEDSGAGVLPADLPLLAKAFKQVSQGATRRYNGTGLGLHICHRYIVCLSASMGVASTFAGEDGSGGTMFACIIPLSLPGNAVGIEEEEKREVGDVPHTCPPARLSTPSKITFLVVDDQPINVKLLVRRIQQVLPGNEVDVLSTTDGLKALGLVAKLRRAADKEACSSFAGIFMDFHMPVLDGLESTKRIRQLEIDNGWPRLSICFCTADATERAQEMFWSAGADDVLAKPWPAGKLEAVCHSMIAKVSKKERELFPSPSSSVT